MRRLLCFMLAVSAVPTSFVTLPDPAFAADGRGQPRLILAQAPEKAGRSGKPTPLVLPEDAMATSGIRFVMVRGLPQGFVLSQGFPVKQTWFLSIAETRNLQIIAPANFSGDVVLEILCFKDSKEPPLSSFTRTFAIKPEDIQVWAAALKEVGQLDKPVDSSKLVVTP